MIHKKIRVKYLSLIKAKKTEGKYFSNIHKKMRHIFITDKYEKEKKILG